MRGTDVGQLAGKRRKCGALREASARVLCVLGIREGVGCGKELAAAVTWSTAEPRARREDEGSVTADALSIGSALGRRRPIRVAIAM